MKAKKIIEKIQRQVVKLSQPEMKQIEDIIENNDSSFWLDEIMKISAFSGIDETCVEDILSEYC